MSRMIQWYYFQGMLFVLIWMFSLCFTNIWKKIAVKINLVDHPGKRKIHSLPVPYLGGASIFFTLWGVLGVGLCFVYLFPDVFETFTEYPFHFIFNVFQVEGQIWGLFLGSLVIFIIGLIDDWSKLSPIQKIAGQFCAAVIIYLFGIRITFFLPYAWMHFLLTVFWIVLITNTFNLLDNMNGLSSGVAIISCFFLWIIATVTGQYLVSLLHLLFAAATLGFWIHNFFRGSIFMGDAGSLFLGFFLSVIVILQTFAVREAHPWLVFTLPLAVFSVPLYDTLSVVIIRLKKGYSPFKADKNHFSHRLVNLGLSQRGAVYFVYLVCFMAGLTSLAFLTADSFILHILFGLHLGLLFVIIGLLEYLGKNKNNGNT